VKQGDWIEAYVYADELLPGLMAQAEIVEKLAQVQPLTILSRRERKPDEGKALVLVLKEAEIALPWASMVDQLAEKQRLTKESQTVEARIAQLDARLKDGAFTSKAPVHVIEKERQRLRMLRDQLERLNLERSRLG
jgi:valyl-tRNA synthetase